MVLAQNIHETKNEQIQISLECDMEPENPTYNSNNKTATCSWLC